MAYKVVKIKKIWDTMFDSYKEGYYSLLVKSPELRMQYKVGEWVEGENGPLMVFSNLENANNFASGRRDSYNEEIFLCEYELWEKEMIMDHGGPLILTVIPSEVTAVRWFWGLSSHFRGKPTIKAGYYAIPPPAGTILAKRVKLIERAKS